MEPKSQGAIIDLPLPIPAPRYRAHTSSHTGPSEGPSNFCQAFKRTSCQLHYVPREPQTFSTEETTISEPLVNTYWILIVDNFQ